MVQLTYSKRVQRRKRETGSAFEYVEVIRDVA